MNGCQNNLKTSCREFEFRISTNMTSPEIKQLIQFLQDNGKCVIDGETKFSVTSQILKELNKILRTIKEDIYVSPISTTNLVNKYSNSNDLMFLYDFIKKMPKLKISDTSSSHNFTIDVSDFTNLKYLEIYKFNVKDVKGIQFLRENLEMVVCNRCLDKIGDLILNSDPDSGVGPMWSKLLHGVFSRNNLNTIDQSFIYTPWLQYLDISYNNLTDLRPLTCLRNLTHLNVAYNRLSSVPEISMYKLEVLLMNHNYITDMSGLSKMESLRELDLSENSILEHANLLPLANLPDLVRLNISKNPISYHSMHRSLTCGYLHENVAREFRVTPQQFLLDGTLLSSSEREFVRYTSRSINNPRNTSPSTIIKIKPSKKTREAVIADVSCDEDDLSSVPTSTPLKAQESDDDDDGIIVKKEMEERVERYGDEYWLLGRPTPNLVNESSPIPSPKRSNIVADRFIHSRSDPQMTNIIIDRSLRNEEPILEESTSNLFDEESSDDIVIHSPDTTLENETPENTESENDSMSESEESDEEGRIEDEPPNMNEGDLWLVTRINGDSSQNIFLTLNDEELKEIDVSSTKVLAKWSLDRIQRCLKISNDPLTIMLTFETFRQHDRTRKYIMEYADAQKLIHQVQVELEKRPIASLNQKVCRCMRCNAVFCKEIQRRIADENIQYTCPVCDSTHVLEEDESALLPSRGSIDNGTSSDSRNDSIKNSSKVTQSPSLSSIGSAASLDQSSDNAYSNDESLTNCQESDIEIISNPSQSSIEVLQVESSRSHDSTATVLSRFNERIGLLETPPSLATVAVNQLLTESSSSGSMTDSICTSYETNPHTRGPQRISSSTLDEVLPEESSAEASPQQRRSEEKTISDSDLSKNAKNLTNESTKLEQPSGIMNYGSVVTALNKFSLSLRKEQNDLVFPYQYSYTNFTDIDHRIKMYVWDQLTPDNADITAFLRVEKLCKCGTSAQPFPALVVLTETKLYFVKIAKEEKDDPVDWLQKFDSVSTDKIKLIQPVLWKQGFCVEVDDRSVSASTLRYVCLLFDEKRADNFLSHVKDLGTIHVQKSEELSEECDLKNILQLDEHVRNFTMSDLITTCKNKDTKRFPLAGLVITNSDFILIKGDAEWLIPKSLVKPTITLRESIGNLMKVTESENNLTLQFLDEVERSEKSWEMKIITSESKNKIIQAIRQPWEEIYSVQLEVTCAAN